MMINFIHKYSEKKHCFLSEVIITCAGKIMLKQILVSEKELSDIHFERLKNPLVCIKSNFTDSDDNMYLTVDSLIDIDNIITGSNNITLRKVNAKPWGYNKMYMYKDLMEGKLYQYIDQIIERKNNYRDFYSALLDSKYPFYDGNWRTCKILFLVAFYSLDSTIKLDFWK